MVGNIFKLVSFIIDGTTLHLHHLASCYHSITLLQPSHNLTKALFPTIAVEVSSSSLCDLILAVKTVFQGNGGLT